MNQNRLYPRLICNNIIGFGHCSRPPLPVRVVSGTGIVRQYTLLRLEYIGYCKAIHAVQTGVHRETAQRSVGSLLPTIPFQCGFIKALLTDKDISCLAVADRLKITDRNDRSTVRAIDRPTDRPTYPTVTTDRPIGQPTDRPNDRATECPTERLTANRPNCPTDRTTDRTTVRSIEQSTNSQANRPHTTDRPTVSPTDRLCNRPND